MKNWLILLFCLLTQVVSAQGYEKGVTKALADQRAKTISDVSYDLTFDIPENQKQPVSGTVIVQFSLDKKTEVVLDFQGKFSGACIINGKKRVAEMKNEHIIIPLKQTKKGLNTVEMNFVSNERALSRDSNILHTVMGPDQARACFPCFDQPDLRARFAAHLNVPNGWKTMVSNSEYAIPTYLFSFVTGKFEEQTGQRDGYPIRIFYRDQEPAKLKQLTKIMDEAGQSLRWMESYTGLKYPFNELSIVILPGYELSGMDHPGAIMLPERRTLLDPRPTKNEQLGRMELIAHETAHQWFGNMVTLKWFDDAWTKEVFANFMASKITRRQLSRTDYGMNFLNTYQTRATALDRTEGTHPIAQKLKNTNHAALLYDDIVYDKAPVMMRILEEIIGPKQMQAGIQHFLQKHYFKSASWDDLTDILDKESPGAGIRQFSDTWVKEKGMPIIHTTYKNGQLVVSQTDPTGRGNFWRQKFDIRIIYDLDRSRTVTVDMTQPTVSINLSLPPSSIIPNYDGRGYGRFTLDNAYTQKLPLRLIVTRDDLCRYALLQTLHDNYLMGRIPASYFGELYRDLLKERNPTIISTVVDHMFKIAFDRPYTERRTLEQCIMDVLPENRSADCRVAIIRKLGTSAVSPEVMAQIHTIWKNQREKQLDEHDYMDLAYRLALTYPGQWKEIISEQRQRLTSDELREEFDFVSRACNPDAKAQKDLFNALLKPENRQHETWALQTLQLLNADIREPQNNAYIEASLNSLSYLQQTSDIFFVTNWLKALFENHKSREALQTVEQFLKKNSNCPEHLRNKVLMASWPLKTKHHKQ